MSGERAKARLIAKAQVMREQMDEAAGELAKLSQDLRKMESLVCRVAAGVIDRVAAGLRK